MKKKPKKPISRKNKTIVASSNSSALDIEQEFEKALEYHKAGNQKGAEKLCKRILQVDPTHSRSLHLLAIIARFRGKNDLAAKLFAKAARSDPTSPPNLGVLVAPEKQSRVQQALSDTQEAYRMGLAFQTQGKPEEAISCYQRALDLKPDYAEAHYSMGIVFQDQDKLTRAISCYRKALRFRPDFPEAYYNMGNVLAQLGDTKKAISCYQKALKHRTDFCEAWFNMALALTLQHRLHDAVTAYRKALQIRPHWPEAHYNVGIIFQLLADSNEAISSFRQALALKPDYAQALSHLTRELQRTCAWRDLEEAYTALDKFTEEALQAGTKPAEHPFFNLTRCDDPSRNLAIATAWSAEISRNVSHLNLGFSFDRRKSLDKKIAVGYLSNEFRDHATTHLMLSLFELHNREEFKILCYSYGKDDGSYYRNRIQRDCDAFVDLTNVAHVKAAKCIYEDGVDILVDLKGHTMGARLDIAALRPAPVQATYLGFPGTTGADFFDYSITDRIVTPENDLPYYSENLVYLPYCYQVNDHTQVVSNKEWQKADLGLRDKSFVFSSFNQAYKIEPVMFGLWMNILKKVPRSILWLLRECETAEKNLRQEAYSRGVDPDRLVFADRIPKKKHMARLRFADLALDTRIVNGHTTTSDALWAGVPVITLKGSHFASRASASILTAIGLPDLISHNLEEYEALVVRLACNPGQLQEVRDKLAKNRLTEPLFDTPRFVKNLEQGYKEMWKIFLAGEEPRQIQVVES